MERERDMQIRTIEVSKTFRTGDYESERIQIGADLDPNEDLDEAYMTLAGKLIHLRELGSSLEGPEVKQVDESIPWGFNPQEFLDYPNWKRGKKKPDGSFDKGNCDYGWEFAENRDGTKNFSDVVLSLLDKGPVRIGDDYEVSKSEDGKFVTIKKGKKSKEIEASKPSAPAKSPTSEAEAAFSEDLRAMLNFELVEDYVKVSPKQYLGSDNFRKIASIVRHQLNGEYVSAGAHSYFRIRKEK